MVELGVAIEGNDIVVLRSEARKTSISEIG
jgi:hypothetical protein